jgi:tetraacyldisaccharide 4'-kinase
MQPLVRLWHRPPRLAYALLPLALLYRAVAAIRSWLYRCGVLVPERLAVPVVMVGNITAGGTGKTPLTGWLARRLQALGRRPAVVSRSYAARAASPARVVAGDDPGVRGDEAVLLAAALPCPVWSGPNRSATARALVAAHPEIDTIVCDDGLQHYALARDCEIAVVDAARGFGNGLPLPAGPLREPLARLARVDAIVVNGDGAVSGLPAGVPILRMALAPSRFRNLADPARSTTAASLRGLRVAALAGIGNPDRFFDALRALGLAFEAHAFPDHHRFSAEDVRFPSSEAIVMTEKDAIKCASFADDRMWAVAVDVTASEDLATLVVERIERAERSARANDARGA